MNTQVSQVPQEIYLKTRSIGPAGYNYFAIPGLSKNLDDTSFIKTICDALCIPLEILNGKRRNREYVYARVAVSLLLKKKNPKMTRRVRGLLLFKDNATMFHYEKNHSNWYNHPQYKEYTDIFNTAKKSVLI